MDSTPKYNTLPKVNNIDFWERVAYNENMLDTGGVKVNEKQDPAVKTLQQNLETIRKVAGWSAEELGTKIGTSKQTIRNLETGKNLLSKTQYIAIRAVLDYKIASNDPESDALRRVVSAILDSEDDDDDKTDEAEIEQLSLQSEETTPKANLTVEKIEKSKHQSRSKAVAVAAGVAAAGIAPWLIKMLKDSSK